MTTLYKTLKNNIGETVEIHYDEDCSTQNPMRDWDSLFNYYTWQGKYQSMQDNNFNSAKEWYDSIMGSGAFERQKEKSFVENKSTVGFSYDLCSNLDKAGIVAKPILCHEHSTVIYYFGTSIDRWDGIIVGFAWQHKSALYEEYQVKRLTKTIKEAAWKVAEAELDVYTKWCNGEVFGFKYFDENGEFLDSCWGFIPEDDDDLIETVKSNLDTKDLSFVEVEEVVIAI